MALAIMPVADDGDVTVAVIVVFLIFDVMCCQLEWYGLRVDEPPEKSKTDLGPAVSLLLF